MRALDGITVVSLEHAVAGPFATRHLADLGARVIKVERPVVGDFARAYDQTVRGQSSYFVWLNRGKESVALDLKRPDDRDFLDVLIAQSDVVLQNLAPGAAERLGVDAASVRLEHPHVVHCSISGYGSPGPYEGRKAYDLLIQCETGLVDATGSAAEPAKVGISVADIATGMYAYSGILSALLHRERTGKGATISVAMIDALGEWMQQPAYFSKYGGQPTKRSGARHASIAPYGPYEAADGSSIFLSVQSDREWALLCRHVLQRPDLVNDARFVTNVDRVANDDAITGILEAAFSSTDVAALGHMLDTYGIANAELRAPAALFEHPQLVARERWRDVETPMGTIRALLPPVTYGDGTPVMGVVPELGEHTTRLRQEFDGGQEGNHDGST